MLDGLIINTPTLIATPSRSDKSLHHWWSRCRNGIRLTCVVGSAPLMSMMRKLWRPSVASSRPTTKMKFPNNDIDLIHPPPQTRSMWRCNINSLRHIVTLPSRWPQNKYSSLGCMQSIHCPLRRCISRAQSHTSMARSTFWAFRSSPPEIKCPCQIDTHWIQSLCAEAATSTQRPSSATQHLKERSQLPVTNTRCGEAIKRLTSTIEEIASMCAVNFRTQRPSLRA